MSGKARPSLLPGRFPRLLILRLIALMAGGRALVPARAEARPPVITTDDLEIALERLPRVHQLDALDLLRLELANLPAGARPQRRRGLRQAIALIRILRRNRLTSEPGNAHPPVLLVAEVTGSTAGSDYRQGR